MATERTTLRDIDLREVSIVNHDHSAGLDLRPILMEFNLYYSLNSPFVTADITIADGEGLIERLPIIGEEFVSISFTLPPDRAGSDEVIIQGLHLYRVSKRTRYEERAEIYVLNLCGPIGIINASTSVDRAYVGLRASEIVSASFQEFLLGSPYFERFRQSGEFNPGLGYTHRGLQTLQNTQGTMSLIGPGGTALEFIMYLCRESVSPDPMDASDYLFYEDRHGFHFRTMTSMLSGEPKKKLYRAETDVIKDAHDVVGFPSDGIVMETLSSPNTLNVLGAYGGGQFRNTTAIFDPVLKLYKEVEYSHGDDLYPEGVRVSPALGTIDEYRTTTIGSFHDQVDSSTSRYLVGQIGNGATYHEREYMAGRALDIHGNVLDPVTVNPFRKHTVVGKRMAKASLLENGIVLTATIPGCHVIDPGDVVEVYIPQNGLNEELRQRYNTLLGETKPRVLVTDVSHRFDLTENRYRTNLRMVKDSYGGPAEGIGRGRPRRVGR